MWLLNLKQKQMKSFITMIISALITNFAFAQSQNVDSIKIYKLALDADIKSVIPLVESYDLQNLNDTCKAFVLQYKNIFVSDQDNSDYLKNHDSKINTLLYIYHNYWRKSLLLNQSFDSLIMNNVYDFLKKDYPNVTNNEDSLNVYLSKYISGKGYYSTGFSRVGKLYDLLVWETEKDTVYHIKNKILDSKVRVVFMTDFVCLGWEDYATFGKYYPGGWAEKDKLFCVIDSYDKTSEKFRVSYLAHEGQHFSDYKHFSDLTSYELEYRAKLVELSLSDERLFHLIEFFINNSNKESKDGHCKANYSVISNLSKRLFDIDFEGNITKWKQVEKKKINKTAYKLLQENTRLLKKTSEKCKK